MTTQITMTTDEYRQALETLGFSQVGFANLVGYNERTARRWADGSFEVPPVIALLLRMMIEFKVSPQRAAEIGSKL